MNDTYIVTACVVIDDILKVYSFEDTCGAKGTAAEVLMMGVIAAIDDLCSESCKQCLCAFCAVDQMKLAFGLCAAHALFVAVVARK